MTPRVSVIIATFNRAKVLRETLEHLARVDTAGLDVDFIVVDNGSTDETASVLETAPSSLRLRTFFDDRPGRGHAINGVFDNERLGELVVLTDDDVTPDTQWLHEIVAASERWPDHSVFGGRITIDWPDGGMPAWAEAKWVRCFGFALHDLDQDEGEYSATGYPFGPCYWVRRSVLEAGVRFDAAIGPRPSNRVMGGETAFLIAARRVGFTPVYVPSAHVLHRVQPDALDFNAMQRRAVRFGRGQFYCYGPPEPGLLKARPRLWRLRRYARLATVVARLLTTIYRTGSPRIASRRLWSIATLAQEWEAVRVGDATPENGVRETSGGLERMMPKPAGAAR